MDYKCGLCVNSKCGLSVDYKNACSVDSICGLNVYYKCGLSVDSKCGLNVDSYNNNNEWFILSQKILVLCRLKKVLAHC